MKRIVITFGLIAGAIFALMNAVILPLSMRGGMNMAHSEVVGYTTMVLAFLMVFVGIRSYRENVGGGRITFGKAFQVGIGITLIACACYVVAWEIAYFSYASDFTAKYSEHILNSMRAKGATAAALAAKKQELQNFQKLYANPAINVAITFMEVFPVGLIMTLISAAILRKKTVPASPAGVAAVA